MLTGEEDQPGVETMGKKTPQTLGPNQRCGKSGGIKVNKHYSLQSNGISDSSSHSFQSLFMDVLHFFLHQVNVLEI